MKKKSPAGLSSRLQMAERWISELKDGAIETILSEEQRKKTEKEMNSLSNMYDKIKCTRREEGEKIIAENFTA